jgi:hypothetical protein
MNYKKNIIPITLIIILFIIIANKTKNIECQIEDKPCPLELTESLDTLKKSSFFFSNVSKNISDTQSKDSIYILESFSKKFPNTLELVFKQEDLKYSLLVSDKIFNIGESGITIPNKTSNKESISIVWQTDTNPVKDNVVINKYHTIFLHIAESLSAASLDNVTIIWVSDSEILLEIPNQPLYIFEQQTIETQIKKVDTIINAKELEEIEEPILEIDMRFNLPVLRTRQ